MSATKQFFPGTGDGKAPAEKSKFAQTCNRLSLFLKEKGNLRVEINAKFDPKGVNPAAKATTVDFLSNMNNVCGENAKKSVPEYNNVILDDSCFDSTTHDISSKAVTKTGQQMTIFYQGEVMVVDDVPEDRARYVMLVAKNGVPPPLHDELASTSEQINGAGDLLENKDSDLPIARRASLNKFLAKRKDRAASVRAAPYQLHSHSSSSAGNDHSFDLNM